MGVKYDFKHEVIQKPSIRPVSLSAGATPGAAVDTDGWTDAGAALEVGALTGTVDVKIQESDTSGGTYTDLPRGGVFAQVSAANQEQLLTIVHTKRWLKATATVVTGPALVAVTVFGRARTT